MLLRACKAGPCNVPVNWEQKLCAPKSGVCLEDVPMKGHPTGIAHLNWRLRLYPRNSQGTFLWSSQVACTCSPSLLTSRPPDCSSNLPWGPVAHLMFGLTPGLITRPHCLHGHTSTYVHIIACLMCRPSGSTRTSFSPQVPGCCLPEIQPCLTPLSWPCLSPPPPSLR